jgi:hypothetical protein
MAFRTVDVRPQFGRCGDHSIQSGDENCEAALPAELEIFVLAEANDRKLTEKMGRL